MCEHARMQITCMYGSAEAVPEMSYHAWIKAALWANSRNFVSPVAISREGSKDPKRVQLHQIEQFMGHASKFCELLP